MLVIVDNGSHDKTTYYTSKLLNEYSGIEYYGSLCGHVVEGFLALFCGCSLGGPSAAFFGYAS
jgi:hypothetical protein